MPVSEIRRELFALGEENYRAFTASLIPTIDAARIIGVRTPALRALAARRAGSDEAADFLRALPHDYFEENQLHAFLVSRERDFAAALALTEQFLPYVDNWATCDQFSPAAFAGRPEALLPAVGRWLCSERTYTARFGVGMLMRYFLGERFDPAHPAAVAALTGEDYYLRTMVAWYFATGLAKQYDAFLPYLEEGRLPAWTHNKAIQKAIESRRVPDERKNRLRSLRRPLDKRDNG